MSAKRGKNEGSTIVIKKEEVIEAGHHGGAWKVAYADFVTAMMAFFLLMWLLNATSEEQRHGIADYFSPFNPIASGQSGNGQPFGGKTPFDSGAMVSDRGVVQIEQTKPTSRTTDDDDDTPTPRQKTGADDSAGNGARDEAAEGPARNGDSHAGSAAAGQAQGGQADAGAAHAGTAAAGTQQSGLAASGTASPGNAATPAPTPQQEQAAFHQAAEQLREAIRNDPTLSSLGKQLAIDETPEGLRIQLMDEDRQSMFAFGSSVPNDRARLLLQKVAPVLAHLTEDISITGHTDAAPYKGGDKSNWELSTERGNATRRVLVDNGLGDVRFRSVSGDADRDPLLPGDPLAAANRRIAIVVLRAAPLPMTIAAPVAAKPPAAAQPKPL